jgi:ankyrin repeat protein
MPDELFNIIWDSAVKCGLPEKRDNNGNLPLHVAAGKIQKHMCTKLLTAFKWSFDPLRMKNNQGKTAAHVATEAVAYRIGPERHYIDKHEKEKHHDQEAGKEEDDDEHDLGLPILTLMWENTPQDGRPSGLSEKDDDRKTCLHLAAENGKSKRHLEIVSPYKKFKKNENGFYSKAIFD